MDSISIQVVTWNVATKFPDPNTNMVSLLGDEKGSPDLVLLSLQEVKSQPQNLLADNLLAGEDPWTTCLRNGLASLGYVKVRTIRLVGIVLSLFCQTKHVPYLRGIETQYNRLGFAGYWGSKGCVSIRFQIYGVSFCVLNAHLAAHTEYNQARIDSYNTILGEHLYSSDSATEMILYHDYILWTGDLNFRLEEGSFTFSEVNTIVEKNNLGKLLAKDQLSIVRQLGQAFSELEETLPTFPPSFKYKVGSSEYDSRRLPAWTDRILFKANVANYDNYKLSLRQHNYSAHQHFIESDHKPVSSRFTASVFSSTTATLLLLPKFVPVVEFIFASGSSYCNEDLLVTYQVKIEERRLLGTWDWIAVFRESDTNLEDYLAYTWATSKLVRDAVYEVILNESFFPAPGSFRLVYFSAGTKDILGWSSPFQLRHRQFLHTNNSRHETAREAKEDDLVSMSYYN